MACWSDVFVTRTQSCLFTCSVRCAMHWSVTLVIDTGQSHWSVTLVSDTGHWHWSVTLVSDTGQWHWSVTLVWSMWVWDIQWACRVFVEVVTSCRNWHGNNVSHLTLSTQVWLDTSTVLFVAIIVRSMLVTWHPCCGLFRWSWVTFRIIASSFKCEFLFCYAAVDPQFITATESDVYSSHAVTSQESETVWLTFSVTCRSICISMSVLLSWRLVDLSLCDTVCGVVLLSVCLSVCLCVCVSVCAWCSVFHICMFSVMEVSDEHVTDLLSLGSTLRQPLRVIEHPLTGTHVPGTTHTHTHTHTATCSL